MGLILLNNPFDNFKNLEFLVLGLDGFIILCHTMKGHPFLAFAKGSQKLFHLLSMHLQLMITIDTLHVKSIVGMLLVMYD